MSNDPFREYIAIQLHNTDNEAYMPITTPRMIIFPDGDNLTNKFNKKQDKLIAGENIKTFNGQSILTEGDIAIPKIQILTQEEYDEIEIKDPETLYFIKEE